MARQDNFGSKFLSTEHRSINIFHLKPEQHPIAVGKVRIANSPVMMLHFPMVQLHDQFAIGHQLLIMASAVAALAPQQALIPAAARFDIPNTD